VAGEDVVARRSTPEDITIGPGGDVWFAERIGKIGYIDP